MLRFMTAGESHGPQLTVIVDGFPAGLSVSEEALEAQMRRRQRGHGRSERQTSMERDHAQIVGGVRGGLSMGSPIALIVENKVWPAWQERMAIAAGGDLGEPLTRLRPGHADLAGALKYGPDDVRNILERASARETAARVAAGALARLLLEEVGIRVNSRTLQIGSVRAPALPALCALRQDPSCEPQIAVYWEGVETSDVRCDDEEATAAMIALIDEGKRNGNTLGGISEVVARGVPAGLGTHTQWDRRLDGLLAQAMLSIQSVKGMEIGDGFWSTGQWGSDVHDPITYSDGWRHLRNHAGGIEGGMTNGEPIIVHVAFKPISTMRHGLPSADWQTGEPVQAHYERSDVCVVPAGGVVAEAMLAWTLATALLEKCGGDSLSEVRRNLAGFLADQGERPRRGVASG
jgi:chorismate synthase